MNVPAREGGSLPAKSGKKIVVIGGGVTGALSALELQRAGHQVTLLEAASWGNGSSSRSAACIRAQFSTPATVKGMIYSTRYYERWAELVGGSASPITQNGYLFLKDHNTNMAALERTVAMQRAAGLTNVDILDRRALDEKFPYLETTGIVAATWCPTDGFLDPSSVYGDAIAAAAACGAEVVQRARAEKVTFGNGLPRSVRTEKSEEFAADIFVNATGVWAPGLSYLFRGYALEIKAIRRYLYFVPGFGSGAGASDLSADDVQRLPMVITPRGCYCRPEGAGGGGLMMGWAHTTAKAVRPEFGNQDDIERGFHPGELTGYGMAVLKEVATYLPDAARMGGLSAATSGFYEVTPDHNPLIGYDPWVPNLIHVAGFSGHGLMHAPYSGLLVAHLVDNGADLETITLPFGLGEVDVTAFAIGRDFQQAEGMVL